jgi:hypothetical protein
MVRSQPRHNSADRRLFPRQQGFQTGHRIHMQVEAISNMQRLGGAASDSFGKGETAVTGDDQHARMLEKPGGNGFHLAVG